MTWREYTLLNNSYQCYETSDRNLQSSNALVTDSLNLLNWYKICNVQMLSVHQKLFIILKNKQLLHCYEILFGYYLGRST